MTLSRDELSTIREKLRDDTTLLTEIEKRVQLYTSMQIREEIREYIRQQLKPVVKKKCKPLGLEAQNRILFVCADAVEKLLLLQYEKYHNTNFLDTEMARLLAGVDNLCEFILQENIPATE